MRNYYGSAMTAGIPIARARPCNWSEGRSSIPTGTANVYTFDPSVNAFPPWQGRRNQRVARIDYANGHTLTSHLFVSAPARGRFPAIMAMRSCSTNTSLRLCPEGLRVQSGSYLRDGEPRHASAPRQVVNYGRNTAPTSTNLSSVVDVMVPDVGL